MISLPYKWSPREYQFGAWNAFQKLGSSTSPIKRVLLNWHRRAGKDEIMLHHNACAAFERVGNYWYMLPEYGQCRKAIWDAVNPHSGKRRIDEAFPEELRASTLQNEMKIVFKNGSTWQLIGSDNYNSLVGSPPCGVTFSEYALSNPSSWGYLRPILLENNGWAIFNSTSRGKNHFYKLKNYAMTQPEWFVQTLTVDDTNVFTKEQLANELAELQAENGDEYGQALFLQEYYCSFDAAVPGAIWGDSIMKLQSAGRIRLVPHTPGYPVFTGWDLGRSDMTAAWFYQVIGSTIKVIDFYKDNLKEVEDFCLMIRDKVKDRKFNMGTNWLPHDAYHTRLGMGGKSIVQQFLEYRRTIKEREYIDIGQFDKAPDLSVQDGIQAARRTFKNCEFDKEHCDVGIDHLKAYHRKWDETSQSYSTTPVHDEHSHPADAFRAVSITWQKSKEIQVVTSLDESLRAGNVKNVTFGELKKQFLKKKRLERAQSY